MDESEDGFEADRDYSFREPLAQTIRRPRVGFFYQLGLVLVAFAMVLLPLIYVCLVALAGWAVYHHAVHHFTPIMSWGTNNWRVMIIKFFVYAAPLIAGLIMVFFMIKPLFARRPKAARPLALNPGAEPVLFAFIESICHAVGAPMPRRVDLDCQLNAAAGFRRGFLSFLGSDLVLVIGLPLAGNLTVSQLAGVLAHEFGHLSQGLGMRMSYLVRSVNGWFARVVYERDEFDVWLSETADTADEWWELILFNLARLGVWCSRLILGGLMFLGHAISCFMSRQMEYNADLNEIRLAGSGTFEIATQKLDTLGAALGRRYKSMRVQWNSSKTLPESLPAALQVAHAGLPAALVEKMHDRLGLQKSGVFATHPSPGERIQRARREAAPGIFHDDRPATVLFQNFAVAARQVTILHYRDDLGIPVVPEMLVPEEPNAKPDATGNTDEPEAAPLENMLYGLGRMLLPFDVAEISPATDVPAALNEAQELDGQLRALEPQLSPVLEQLHSTRHAWMLAEAKARLGLNNADDPEPQHLAGEIEELKHSLREVSGAVKRRFELAASVARAGNGDSETALAQLVARTAEYPRWRDAADELEITMRMSELAQSHPEARDAVAKQIDSIKKRIAAEEGGTALAKPAGTGLRLRIAKSAPDTSAHQLAELRKVIRARLSAYERNLETIWQIGQRAE